MEEALISLLLGDAAVQASLGNRVNWVRKPQGVAGEPYSILQRASGTTDYHSAGPSGYAQRRVQIDTYGESYAAVIAATRAIRRRLSGYRGGIFQGIFLDSERDLPAADAGEVNRLFRVSSDYIIHYTET